MKKIIISIVACFALVLGSVIAWCCYQDLLAGFLFICALIHSCLFEEGRQEYKALKENHYA